MESNRDVRFSKAEEKLKPYFGRMANNNEAFRKGVSEATYQGESFVQHSLKRSFLSKCKIVQCDFSEAAVTGSTFIKCSLENCEINKASFMCCDFMNTVFFDIRGKTEATNFSHSNFLACEFIDGDIIHCTVFHSLFDNCTFENFEFRSSTWENTEFYNCKFNNVEMCNVNLEYTKFVDPTMKNVVLPLFQVAYMIGMPEYLRSTNDDVWLDGNNQRLSIQEYMLLWDDLCVWYENKNEYFPLANMVLATGDIQRAFSLIEEGISEALKIGDFRLIKHYCRLLTASPSFLPAQIGKIMSSLEDIYTEQDDKYKLNKYLSNFGEIRNLLLNGNFGMLTLKLTIKTDIPAEDSETVGCFVSELNEALLSIIGDSRSHSVELRHNSPHEFLVSLVNDPAQIMAILLQLGTLLAVSSKEIDLWIARIKHIYELKKAIKEDKKDRANKQQQKHESDEIKALQDNIELLREQLNEKEHSSNGQRVTVIIQHVVDVNFIIL
jgi:uncharacterized protein YjbI with pentapeptide repeats